MRRYLVAAAALAAGISVAGGLVWYGSPGRGAVEVYVVGRDLPAGADLPLDALRLAPMRLPADAASSLLPRGSERLIAGSRTVHELTAGQLLQRSDLAPRASAPDRRLVLLPIKDAPPVASGDRIDLLVVTGAGDRVVVQPLAVGLEVRAAGAGGIVVAAPSRPAAALVYVGATSHLVAVVAAASSGAGEEGTVASLDQAAAALRG